MPWHDYIVLRNIHGIGSEPFFVRPNLKRRVYFLFYYQTQSPYFQYLFTDWTRRVTWRGLAPCASCTVHRVSIPTNFWLHFRTVLRPVARLASLSAFPLPAIQYLYGLGPSVPQFQHRPQSVHHRHNVLK